MLMSNSTPRWARRNQAIGADADGGQVPSQVTGALIQLTIGQASLIADHGESVGGTADLCLEELMDTEIQVVISRGGVPLHQELSTFGLSQKLHAAKTLIWSRHHALQQRLEMAEHTLDRPSLKPASHHTRSRAGRQERPSPSGDSLSDRRNQHL